MCQLMSIFAKGKTGGEAMNGGKKDGSWTYHPMLGLIERRTSWLVVRSSSDRPYLGST